MRLEDLPADWTNLAICGVIVLIFVAWGAHSWLQKRPSPQEVERGRRNLLQAIGKVGDSTVTEIQGPFVFYSYEVRGVEYLASQDIGWLDALPEEERWGVVGAASVKYDPRNPANSIVVAERWTGLRKTSAETEH